MSLFLQFISARVLHGIQTQAYRLVLITCFLLTPFLTTAQSYSDVRPDRFLIPMGFDDNDQIVITADGYLPTPCHMLGQAKVKVYKDKRTIAVAMTRINPRQMCVQERALFEREFNLGLLPAGQYTIVSVPLKDLENESQVVMAARRLHVQQSQQQNIPSPGHNGHHIAAGMNVLTAPAQGSEAIAALPQTPSSRQFTVKKSKPTLSVDDYLYAPVDQATLSNTRSGLLLKLEGIFRNSCSTMKDILVEYKNDVLVIQPIYTIKQDSNCKTGSFHFVETRLFPHSLLRDQPDGKSGNANNIGNNGATGNHLQNNNQNGVSQDNAFPFPVERRILLHVRKTGGQFINQILTIYLPQ